MPPHQGGRSDQAQATVYQKHRSPQSRKTMYGPMEADACPVFYLFILFYFIKKIHKKIIYIYIYIYYIWNIFKIFQN
jgi:hypothetical protein